VEGAREMRTLRIAATIVLVHFSSEYTYTYLQRFFFTFR
jgi:hypothetical protein